MKNRLQFIHHNEIFASRELAIQYLKELQVNSRPSLFAEPIVVKYESGDEEKGPNIILAIGSNGIGEYNAEYRPSDQRVFFIDVTAEQESIEDLYEKLEAAIQALTIIPLESDTLKTLIDKTADGTYISGDVKVADSKIIHSIEKPNTIQVLEGDGIYHYVNLEYTEEGKLVFQVNEDIKEMSIPCVVSGEYIYTGDDAENIILNLNDGNTIKINVGKLIDEWTVMPADANYTPIILDKKEIVSEECPHGVESWQDVLSADIRLHEGDGNILYKADSGQTLFAKVFLDYSELENKLIFTWSENGEVNTKDIKLNGVNVIDSITYDEETEEIVIKYRTSPAAEPVELRIPVSDIIREWNVNNVGHNVELVRVESISGIDQLSADVRIWAGDNNIIEKKGDNNSIYVRGEADNIKFGESDVDAELKRLNSEKTRVENKLDEEIARASSAENVLTDKIGTGFTDDQHENVTAKFNSLSDTLDATVSDLEAESEARAAKDEELSTAIENEAERAEFAEAEINASLTAETARAMGVENQLSGEITTLDNTIGSGFTSDNHETVTYKFNALSAKTDAEISRSTTADDELQNAINAEASRAEGVESSIQSAVNDINDRIGDGFTARNTVADKIAAEETRATGAEEALDDKINALSANTESRVHSVSAGNSSISVDNTDAVNPKVMVALNQGDDNIIELNEGLNAIVKLDYDATTNKLFFRTTKEEKEIALVSNSIVDNVYYDPVREAIVIEYTINGEHHSVIVPVRDLINEWTVANTSTIKLTKELNPSGSTGGHSEDILTADAIISEEPGNLLTILNGLFVSNSGIVANEQAIAAEVSRATARENEIEASANQKLSAISAADTSITITNGNGTHPEVAVSLSHTNGNAIDLRVDGLYATSDLSYDTSANTLTFTKSVNGGSTDIKTLQLNNDTVINDISYDATNEQIVLTYTTNKVQKTVTCDLEVVIQEWEIDNVGHTVTLSRVRSKSGKDKVSADVNVSTSSDNILEVVDNTLKVSNSSIVALSNRLESEIANVDSRINSEASARTNADTAIRNELTLSATSLNNAIGSEAALRASGDSAILSAVADLRTRITTEQTLRESADENIRTSLSNSIANEAATRESQINTLRTDTDTKIAFVSAQTNSVDQKATLNTQRISDINGIIGGGFTSSDTIRANIDSINNAIDNINDKTLTGVTSKDATIIIDPTSPRNPKISVGIDSIDGNNIIKNLNGNGIYANVSLTYDEVSNTLTFATTNGSQTIHLLSNSLVESITYDPNTKCLVFIYTVNGVEQRLEVSVADLVDTLLVNNPGDSPVELTLVNSDSGSVLSADVRLSTYHDDNALQKDGNTLYVSAKELFNGMANHVQFTPTTSEKPVAGESGTVYFFKDTDEDGNLIYSAKVLELDCGTY